MKWPLVYLVLAFSGGHAGGIKVNVHSVQLEEQRKFSEDASSTVQSFFGLRDWAEPEGGRIMKNAQNVTWDNVSHVPRALQYFFTITWILMIGGLPLYVRMLDGSVAPRQNKFGTTTELSLSIALWTTLFGGLGLFTNIILFQSPHFSEVRPLTMIECIYLMSQVMTTVGYGDITPAKLRGQVFVGFYILGAIFVIALMVSQMMEHVSRKTQSYEKDLQMTIQKSLKGDKDDSAASTLHHLFGKPRHPPKAPLIQSIVIFLVVDAIFVAFYVLWPGEGKTVGQAIYMSIVTFSSVGFGAFTPVTESGMIFNAFWMIIGSVSLVSVITNFSKLMMQLQSFERFDRAALDDNVKKLENNRWGAAEGGENVTEAEFVMFGLIAQGLVKEEAIESIQETFQQLKPNKDGCVDIIKIKEAVTEDWKTH